MSTVGRLGNPPSQRTLLLIAAGAIGATLVTIWWIFANYYQIENPDHTGHFSWLASGLFWVFVGEAAWMRWPTSRIGPVMVFAGIAHVFYAPGLLALSAPWLLSAALDGVELLLVAYAFLSWPTGRLIAPTDHRLFEILAGWLVIATVLSIAANPHHLNPAGVITDEGSRSATYAALDAVGAVLLLVVAARVVAQWRSAPTASRRIRTPIMVALLPYVVVLAFGWLDRLIGPNVVTDLANSWPGGLRDWAFPIAVAYVLWVEGSTDVERLPAKTLTTDGPA